MALAGAICGAVAVGLFLIWLVRLVIGAFNSDSSSYDTPAESRRQFAGGNSVAVGAGPSAFNCSVS